MNTEEMMKMCRSLAYKYNAPNHFDDLVSEGMLECLEQVDQGNTHGANLRRMANRAMHDYLNLKTLPVTVPVSDLSRSLSRGHEGNHTYSKEGLGMLDLAVHSTAVPMGPTTDQADEESDAATIYEGKRNLIDIIRVARETLSDSDWELFSNYYLLSTPTVEIADHAGVSRQSVEKRLRKCVINVTNSMKF